MSKAAMILACICLLATTAWADFPTDRAAALKLVREGKHDEALTRFVALADAATDPQQKSEALAQAADCALKLKQPQQAMELARKIPLPERSKLVQMRVLIDGRGYDALLSQFKDEDLSTWPEALAGEAHYMRGVAYAKKEQGEAAEKEFDSALKLLGEGQVRGQAALARAENYRKLLKDIDKARQAYADLQQIEIKRDRFGWLYMSGVIGEAEILRQQGKLDDALAVLNRVNLAELKSGYWGAQLYVAHAELLIARGQKTEAAAMLRQALERSTQDFQKTAIQKQLDQLSVAP